MGMVSRLLGYFPHATSGMAIPESQQYLGKSSGGNLEAIHRQYLGQTGWIRSRQSRRSLDGNGHFLPWLTYSSITFLETLKLIQMNVLEFGGGSSTFWFSERAASVTTVEDDPAYTKALRKLPFPFPVKVIDFSDIPLESEGQNFLSDIPREFWEGDLTGVHLLGLEAFASRLPEIARLVQCADLILVDGGPRNIFLWMIREYSKPDAIIIVDNSDRPDVSKGLSLFEDTSYMKIPFSGLGPLNAYGWETSVLVSYQSLADGTARQWLAARP